MNTIAKIIGGGLMLVGLQGMAAGEMAVSDQEGTIVLESAASTPDADQPASSPVAADTAAAPQGQPVQADAPATRVPVKAYYEKVDRARIEKRMDDRAARTLKRKTSAEKDAAERAVKAQANPPVQQEQGTVQQDQGSSGDQGPPPGQ